MIRAQWESDRDSRLADAFRESRSLQAKLLELAQLPELTMAEEEEMASLHRKIAETEDEIEAIGAETYERALADASSHLADEARKGRK